MPLRYIRASLREETTFYKGTCLLLRDLLARNCGRGMGSKPRPVFVLPPCSLRLREQRRSLGGHHAKDLRRRSEPQFTAKNSFPPDTLVQSATVCGARGTLYRVRNRESHLDSRYVNW